MLKLPYNYTQVPVGSILKNSECEYIAKNIMIILKRTGNVFRELSFEEYKKERMKDGAKESCFSKEKIYFDKVIQYCCSSEKADSFCSSWFKALV